MKKVLVIYYSQSGQLTEIIDNFLKPFNNKIIERVEIYPAKKYPFPWTSQEFFNVMPESVLEESIELKKMKFEHDNYSLIIIGYQPWFLSPSLPITSLLKNQSFRYLLNNTPVITIIGARNMWLNAQESIKMYIKKSGGILVGNIPFIDRNNNFLSAISILDWMFKGVKRRYLNVFPIPGVSEKDIKGAGLLGTIVNNAYYRGDFTTLQENILKTGLIEIKTNLLFIELRAKRIFKIWANIIKKRGDRGKERIRLIKLFKYYLIIALFLIAPIILVVYDLFILPFSFFAVKQKKRYFYDVIMR